MEPRSSHRSRAREPHGSSGGDRHHSRSSGRRHGESASRRREQESSRERSSGAGGRSRRDRERSGSRSRRRHGDASNRDGGSPSASASGSGDALPSEAAPSDAGVGDASGAQPAQSSRSSLLPLPTALGGAPLPTAFPALGTALASHAVAAAAAPVPVVAPLSGLGGTSAFSGGALDALRPPPHRTAPPSLPPLDTSFAASAVTAGSSTGSGASAHVLLPPPPPPTLPSTLLAAPPASSALFPALPPQQHQARVSALSGIATTLLQRRSQLAARLDRLRQQASSLAAARAAIERDALAEMDAALARLHAAEAAKLTVLQAEADAVGATMGAVDGFYRSLRAFQSLSPQSAGGGGGGDVFLAAPGGGSSGSGVPLQQAYAELAADAERLAAQTQAVLGRPEVIVPVDDLPREAAARSAAVAQVRLLSEALTAKDRLIAQLTQAAGGVGSGLGGSAPAPEVPPLLPSPPAAAAAAAAARLGSGATSQPRPPTVDSAAASAADARYRAQERQWAALADRLTADLDAVTDELLALQAAAAASASGVEGGEGSGSGGGHARHRWRPAGVGLPREQPARRRGPPPTYAHLHHQQQQIYQQPLYPQHYQQPPPPPRRPHASRQQPTAGVPSQHQHQPQSQPHPQRPAQFHPFDGGGGGGGGFVSDEDGDGTLRTYHSSLLRFMPQYAAQQQPPVGADGDQGADATAPFQPVRPPPPPSEAAASAVGEPPRGRQPVHSFGDPHAPRAFSAPATRRGAAVPPAQPPRPLQPLPLHPTLGVVNAADDALPPAPQSQRTYKAGSVRLRLAPHESQAPPVAQFQPPVQPPPAPAGGARPPVHSFTEGVAAFTAPSPLPLPRSSPALGAAAAASAAPLTGSGASLPMQTPQPAATHDAGPRESWRIADRLVAPTPAAARRAEASASTALPPLPVVLPSSSNLTQVTQPQAGSATQISTPPPAASSAASSSGSSLTTPAGTASAAAAASAHPHLPVPPLRQPSAASASDSMAALQRQPSTGRLSDVGGGSVAGSGTGTIVIGGVTYTTTGGPASASVSASASARSGRLHPHHPPPLPLDPAYGSRVSQIYGRTLAMLAGAAAVGAGAPPQPQAFTGGYAPDVAPSPLFGAAPAPPPPSLPGGFRLAAQPPLATASQLPWPAALTTAGGSGSGSASRAPPIQLRV